MLLSSDLLICFIINLHKPCSSLKIPCKGKKEVSVSCGNNNNMKTQREKIVTVGNHRHPNYYNS